MPKIVTYPTKDITLKTGKSHVFWSGLTGGAVKVRCGKCKKLRRVIAFIVNQKGYTGLHKECRHDHLRPSGNEDLPGGAIFHWDIHDPDNDKPKRRLMSWPSCGHKAYASYRYHWQAEGKSPRCTICHPSERTGEVLLPKGTIAIYDMDKRLVCHHPNGGRYFKIAIKCRGCFEKTGLLKHVSLVTISEYLSGKRNYSELCDDCLRDDHPLKLKGEEAIKTSLHGTTTDFTRENESGEVPSIYKLCGCEKWFTREDALTHWKRRPGRCRKCQHDPERFAARVEARRQNSNEQEKGSAGERTDAKNRNREQWIIEAVNGVRELWAATATFSRRSLEERCDMITEADLAPYLGNSSKERKHQVQHTRRRLEACRVKEMFPDGEQWYSQFRKAVVKWIEQGIPSEEIVCKLNTLLVPSRAVA